MFAPSSPPLDCRSVLVFGGARSGKSRYAQALAESARAERLYVATAEAGDGEMASRIAKHQADRGAGWTTREETLDLVGVLRAEAREDRVLLVDCLTLWLSNAMFAESDLAREIALLAEATRAALGPVVFVSNETGQGIVPETRLGRDFRDWQGKANQELAAACDAVVFVAAGLPTLLKPAATPNLRLR